MAARLVSHRGDFLEASGAEKQASARADTSSRRHKHGEAVTKQRGLGQLLSVEVGIEILGFDLAPHRPGSPPPAILRIRPSSSFFSASAASGDESACGVICSHGLEESLTRKCDSMRSRAAVTVVAPPSTA